MLTGTERRPASDESATKKVLDMVRDVIRKKKDRLAGYRIILFGSRARREYGARSDFDIGVYGDTSLPVDLYSEIESDFDDLPTLYKIDWVDLHKVSPRFRAQALKESITLHEG